MTDDSKALAIECPYCGAKPGDECLSGGVHVERRTAAAVGRRTLYITFGVQYGTPAERELWTKEPHPAGDWVTGNGYLAVEYPVLNDDVPWSRARARTAVFTWLDGRFAFDDDEVPAERYAPAGEIARMVLP